MFNIKTRQLFLVFLGLLVVSLLVAKIHPSSLAETRTETKKSEHLHERNVAVEKENFAKAKPMQIYAFPFCVGETGFYEYKIKIDANTKLRQGDVVTTYPPDKAYLFSISHVDPSENIAYALLISGQKDEEVPLFAPLTVFM